MSTKCRNPFTGSGHSFTAGAVIIELVPCGRNPFTGSGHSFYDKLASGIAVLPPS